MSFNPTYPHNLELLPPNINGKDPDFIDLLIKARTELAELKGFSFSLPNPMLLSSPSIIKESLASSNIENIHTTLVDVLQNQLFPETEQRAPDKEVLRYRDAIVWGYENIGKYSLSTRLILGIQKHLIPESYGGYRKQQNKIANTDLKETLYTPPLASRIAELMGNWENFANTRHEQLDPLIKCAIAHYQFEAIHPFDDGNGRTGRMLIVLQLILDEILSFPTLFISGYINANRKEYYRLLSEVTKSGKWDEFIIFMLQAFYSQAKATKETLFKVMHLFFEMKKEIKEKHKKIYSADLVESLFSYPFVTPVKLARELGIHYTTASRHLWALVKAGVLKESKVGKYQFFINDKLLAIIKSS